LAVATGRTGSGADLGHSSWGQRMSGDFATRLRGARRHTIGDLLRRSARRYPDRIAIRCADVAWSYNEFDSICNRLARGLSEKGIAIGDRVAIVSRNSHAFAAMRYALARVGAVLVPINFMLNADEIAFILRSSGAKAVAAGPDFTDVCRLAVTRDTRVEWMLALPGEDQPSDPGAGIELEALLHPDASHFEADLDDTMLAQLVYTSGTESLPKGAMLTHGAVMWEYATCVVDCAMEARDVMLHALPLYHCAQLDVFLGPGIYLGMTNVITGQPKPDVILPLLERHGITSFFAPPTVWIALLRSPLFDGTDLSALEKGYYGASIMPVEVLRELQQRLPKVRLWNLYGQTEIAPVATTLQPEDQIRKAGSAGKPGLNVETRVVDDAMQDVAIGEIGEVVHRSPQLLLGYYDDPGRTEAAFEGGWFHSGDLATIDAEGYITIVDRKKDMIKTGGENVASREVEETIYRVPEVSEVAVIGLSDPRWIEAVTAVVVLKAGKIIDEAALMAHCGRYLASFKVPKRVVFVDSLPKNPSGKVLKRDLRLQLDGVGKGQPG
jgi:fatty-acyl-CoA synthase